MADHVASAGEALLRRADLDAERWTGLARMGAAVVLLVLIYLIAQDLPDSAAIAKQLKVARITLWLFLLLGLVGFLVARFGYYFPSFAYATTTADALLVSTNLWISLNSAELSGNFFSVFPVVWLIPVALAGTLLRFRPRLQLFTGVLYILALLVVVVEAGYAGLEERTRQVTTTPLLYGWPPNSVRITMIGICAAILVGVAAWGRRILLQAVDETGRRVALARYLPAELAPVLAAGGIEALRSGQRNAVGLLFADIRNSTAMEETLDPAALTAFIGAFRQRVTRAAASNGGVIDKFIGDGAFLVFGIVEPKPDDAARAIRCGKDVLSHVAQWNEERAGRGEPPVAVGVGVHFGEAFVGAIGDTSRLEFTVLGDAVNVAHRLEQATKDHRVPMLVSEEALVAAGEHPGSWRPLGSERLRGRAAPVKVHALALIDANATASLRPAASGV